MQSPRDGKMRARKTLRLCAECLRALPKHVKGCPQENSDSPRAILRQREGLYGKSDERE